MRVLLLRARLCHTKSGWGHSPLDDVWGGVHKGGEVEPHGALLRGDGEVAQAKARR